MEVTAIVPIPAGSPDAVLTPVAGRSPLIRIVAALAPAAEVVVAVAQALVGPVHAHLSGHGMASVSVVAATSPGDRAHCLEAGLRARPGATHVLVHHIGWPVFDPITAHRVVTALRHGATAVLPARPVTDSIKAVDDRGTVIATLDRAQLRSIQYPRGFRADALASLLEGTADSAFDDVAAVLSMELPIEVIEGDRSAFSVDLPRDADYLAAVIEDRRSGFSR
ncbi:hypothetical protein ASG82_00600 [Mycobacterium sp. Soil538]|nr:hypothetical protein ASG82_00600 [Mycobacterium sp. Soil538]